jgi:paraquat-inducible protein B
MAGKLGNYLYYDDNQKAYKVKLDKTNAVAMGFTAAQAGDSSPSLPKRFKMRLAHFQTSDNLHKRNLPAPKNNSDKLKSGATVSLPVYNEGSQQNQTFTITGRTGEKQTYN